MCKLCPVQSIATVPQVHQQPKRKLDVFVSMISKYRCINKCPTSCVQLYQLFQYMQLGAMSRCSRLLWVLARCCIQVHVSSYCTFVGGGLLNKCARILNRCQEIKQAPRSFNRCQDNKWLIVQSGWQINKLNHMLQSQCCLKTAENAKNGMRVH